MTSYIQEECYRMEMEAQRDSMDSESARLQALVEEGDTILQELIDWQEWKGE